MGSIRSRRRCTRRRPSATRTVLAKAPTAHQIALARHCRAALKKIFFACPGGRADESALLEIKELCLGALRAVDDPICSGKLVTIHACAAALYSDKAHRHWDRDGTPGVDRLRRRIFAALNTYQRRLYRLGAAAERERSEAYLRREAAEPATHPVAEPAIPR